TALAGCVTFSPLLVKYSTPVAFFPDLSVRTRVTAASACIRAPAFNARGKYTASGFANAPMGHPASHQPSHRQAGRPLYGCDSTAMGIGAVCMFSAAKPRANTWPWLDTNTGGSGYGSPGGRQISFAASPDIPTSRWTWS